MTGGPPQEGPDQGEQSDLHPQPPRKQGLWKDPKSDAGRRTVVLPKQAMQAIAAHIDAFGCANTGELVTGPMGAPARRARISEAWQTAKATVGVDPDMHPHDLRHHAATLMAQMPGITTKELMARIGHSSPRAALIYQHATAERDRQVADFLEERLEAARPATPRIVALPEPAGAAVHSARGFFAGFSEPPRGRSNSKNSR